MPATTLQRAAAYAVHLFTASGLVVAFYALLAVEREDYRVAMLLLLVTLVIDGIDGTFARLARVREVLPEMDGKYIDYVIDFFTYAIIPAYFIYKGVNLEAGWRMPLIILILLVSAIYYGRTDMSDGTHFIGFPVLWNAVAFFLFFVLDVGPHWNGVLIVTFAILHFVPVLFAYPSRKGKYFWPTLINTLVFIALFVAIPWVYPARYDWMIWLMIGTVLYYALHAGLETWRVHREGTTAS